MKLAAAEWRAKKEKDEKAKDKMGFESIEPRHRVDSLLTCVPLPAFWEWLSLTPAPWWDCRLLYYDSHV